MTRKRFQEIIQNLCFANNEVQDTNDKVANIYPLQDHFNKKFSENLGNRENQTIDEHKCKFKGKSSMT